MNVTQSPEVKALLKRINRKLAHSNLAVRTSRSNSQRGDGYGGLHHTPYGSFYMVERYTNFILLVTQDLDSLAKGLGVLREGDFMRWA